MDSHAYPGILPPVNRKMSFALGSLLLIGLFPVVAAEPIVAGVASSKLDPELKGQVLIEELNCAACHSADPSLAGRSKKAPRLSDVGSRVNPAYLEAFIGDPHTVKPGTTMPDLLSQLGGEEKKQVATSITHFLLSLKKNDFSLQAPDSVAAEKGKALFHSRGCVQCHSPRDDKGVELSFVNSVPLGALEKKYSVASLSEFLRQPHASRPSGRMPDMRLQGQDVERIAHYLLQNTRVPGPLAYKLFRGQVWEGLGSAEVKAERAGLVKDFDLQSLGGVQHHTGIEYDGWLNVARKGSYTFYLTMNGGSLIVDGKPLVQEDPSDRRGVKDLKGTVELDSGWRRIQLTYFHTGHEPKFSCEMEGPEFTRQAIPSLMLSVSNEKIPAFAAPDVDAGLAAKGRENFEKIGCANCHDDLKVPARPALAFAKLDSSRGCLSATAGAWPKYDLNVEQRGWIAKAMPNAEKPQLTDKQKIDKTLVTFNCLACHERDGLGGIAPERKEFFTGTQPGLGDQGRIPPPLSYVGAKLKPEWIGEVMLHGKRQREYVDASMPQFGEANVGHLVELFGKVDQLEAAVMPKVASIKESKSAGYEMIGSTGFSCIACHEFNGQKSGELSALDISHVTERIQKNWFYLYMKQPSRFHPTVIMPSYWPGGQSIRPTILGGNTDQQIEALWTYLEDGPRAKKPLGLSRQSNELNVSDVTEICRGRSSVGYRGIAVGYPERINLAFDSGEMSLRQLWKGDFANADIGSFHPRGTDLISFPQGIPFHRLKSLDDNWPYKGKNDQAFPQDQGYQFRGYHLDAARRPTFLYHYGDIAVEDYFEDVHDKDGKPYFKRTLRFDADSAQKPFYFRAAAGKKIEKSSERVFGIDQLQLRITSEHTAIVRDGNPAELLIPLTLPKGRSILTLEFQW
jgi:mono/diheme cytochrome c family protein